MYAGRKEVGYQVSATEKVHRLSPSSQGKSKFFKKGIDISTVIYYNNIIREGQGSRKAVVMYYDSFDCEVTVEELSYGSATFEINEEDFEEWDNEPNDYDLEYDYAWG